MNLLQKQTFRSRVEHFLDIYRIFIYLCLYECDKSSHHWKTPAQKSNQKADKKSDPKKAP